MKANGIIAGGGGGIGGISIELSITGCIFSILNSLNFIKEKNINEIKETKIIKNFNTNLPIK